MKELRPCVCADAMCVDKRRATNVAADVLTQFVRRTEMRPCATAPIPNPTTDEFPQALVANPDWSASHAQRAIGKNAENRIIALPVCIRGPKGRTRAPLGAARPMW